MVTRAAPAHADSSSDNTIVAYGNAPFLGPQSSMNLASPFVDAVATPNGDGYWAVAADGGVFSFGNAPFLGSMGGKQLNKPIVGIAAAPAGLGYWLVASDGGIFAYGSAAFFGSTGGIRLNQPVVGMAPAPKGNGYWLVASDGGIFAYGTAPFLGSTGGIKLNQPVIGMAATPSTNGYWLAAKDGGIFAYGDAPFRGSGATEGLQAPVVDIAAPPSGAGYWLAQLDGQVSAYGVPDHSHSTGTGPGESGSAPTVGMFANPKGDGYWVVRGETQVFDTTSTSGASVQAIQQRLTDLGYWLGPVNGVYGDLTTQAVYAFQKVNGLTVDGQVGPQTAAALASAKRPLPKSTSGDLVEVDKTRQVVFIVRGGRAQWTFNTSTGTEKPYTFEGQKYLADTPVGRFTITRQVDGYDEGPLGRLYRPKYFHPDGIALHGYTQVPPYPASHGCVRFTNAAIDFIWNTNLAPIGTTVWVYGRFPGT
jgi:lipoprotein-anchoring transpeptidase ErfK/SrfK